MTHVYWYMLIDYVNWYLLIDTCKQPTSAYHWIPSMATAVHRLAIAFAGHRLQYRVDRVSMASDVNRWSLTFSRDKNLNVIIHGNTYFYLGGSYATVRRKEAEWSHKPVGGCEVPCSGTKE